MGIPSPPPNGPSLGGRGRGLKPEGRFSCLLLWHGTPLIILAKKEKKIVFRRLSHIGIQEISQKQTLTKLAAKTMSRLMACPASSILAYSAASPIMRAALRTSPQVSSKRWMVRTIEPICVMKIEGTRAGMLESILCSACARFHYQDQKNATLCLTFLNIRQLRDLLERHASGPLVHHLRQPEPQLRRPRRWRRL